LKGSCDLAADPEAASPAIGDDVAADLSSDVEEASPWLVSEALADSVAELPWSAFVGFVVAETVVDPVDP
jgi:hypothetical protein